MRHKLAGDVEAHTGKQLRDALAENRNDRLRADRLAATMLEAANGLDVLARQGMQAGGIAANLRASVARLQKQRIKAARY
jgi:hypothetical protein